MPVLKDLRKVKNSIYSISLLCAVLCVVLDFRLRSRRPQCDDNTIVQPECDHVARPVGKSFQRLFTVKFVCGPCNKYITGKNKRGVPEKFRSNTLLNLQICLCRPFDYISSELKY
jgi:hypothetical protein